MICSLVVAASTNDVIGDDGALPWHLPGDLREFKRRTTGHVLAAGRATQDAIVARLGHPLPHRTTLVLSRSQPGAFRSFDEVRCRAEELAREQGQDEWFVIGGAAVYADALVAADRVHLTRVHAEIDGDTAMPGGWLDEFRRVDVSDAHTEGDLTYTFETWDRA